jgi:hypothetical protein
MNQAFATNNLQHTANTFLMFVTSNLVSTRTIIRDYEAKVAFEGDIVKARFPRERSTAHNQPDAPHLDCELKDWMSVSFLMRQSDREKTFGDIVNEYIEPSAILMAESLDRSVLFNMAAKAQHRRGTPGRGFEFPGDLGGKILVVSPNAQADLVMDVRFQPTQRERDGTAWDRAALSGEQIFMDQACPGVFTNMGELGCKDDVGKVLSNHRIGDIGLLYDPGGVAIACRPLPEEGGAVAAFQGLAARVQVSEFKYPTEEGEEEGETLDMVTFNMLTGVAVRPELVTAIFS